MQEPIRFIVHEREIAAGTKFAVEVKKLEKFWPAEEYHQDYLDKNPDGYCHIPSRLLHLKEASRE